MRGALHGPYDGGGDTRREPCRLPNHGASRAQRAIVDFERTLNGNLSGRFLVSHGAFGNGPVRFHVLKGVGRFRQAYRTRKKLHVPEGGLVVITLQASLPASTIVVYDRRPGRDQRPARASN